MTQAGRVFGALAGAAALGVAGLLLLGVDALASGGVLSYVAASNGEVWKVAGAAVALTLVVIMTHRASRRGLFLGALVSAVGLAIVAALLLLSAVSDSNGTLGAAGASLGLCVVSPWWGSRGRRSGRFLRASVVLAALLASFLLVVTAQSLRTIVQYPATFCRTGTSQALLLGGSCLLCVSLLALFETCAWARRRAG